MLYKINKNKIDERILKEATEVMRNGGVIIYPTDTAYALGCDAGNEEAAEKIFKIKKRDMGKSLPVIVGDLGMAAEFFKFSKKEKELAEKFWPDSVETHCDASLRRICKSPSNESPYVETQNLASLQPRTNFKRGTDKKGKLSLVLKAKKNAAIAKPVIAPDGTVAVRVPESLWSRALSLELGRPIISTSANIAGAGSCYSVREIKNTGVDYENIDLILDAGKLSRVLPSTIVRVKNNKIFVLREGSVKILDFRI